MKNFKKKQFKTSFFNINISLYHLQNKIQDKTKFSLKIQFGVNKKKKKERNQFHVLLNKIKSNWSV